MNVCIVGLGKIGLPLSLQIAHRGHHTIGLDIDDHLIDLVNRGEEPFPGEPGLVDRLVAARAAGTFHATSDVQSAVSVADVVVIVVPLVVDEAKKPDFDALDAATRAIAPHLRPDSLVSYETTLPVGTTRNRFTAMLAEGSGLEPGVDLYVCFSPERVSSGRVFDDLGRYPKLVGGIDDESGVRAVDFYEAVLEFNARPDLDRENGVWNVGNAEAAELVKLAETTYRDVNIALANEFAVYAERLGVSVFEVIDAANSQPFSHIHQPGIAVGGHCIPVYPHLYLHTDPAARMPAASRFVNDSMPAHAAETLSALIGDLEGKKVVVLGAAYRGGVKETAFSGVFPTVAALEQLGAVVTVHDPLFDNDELEALGFSSYALGDPVEAAIVQTDHEQYRRLTAADLPGVEGVVDGRNLLDSLQWRGWGVDVRTIGSGATPS
ncbi:MAG: nucleotide sugar dehydrogenase [Actinomycetia bacterium]|nr:nucleotide sugar dehydrogenase [Actinomycetes bacterium]